MIELKGVSKTYDNGTTALRGIDLSIGKGEFVFVLGHSGAGKSTLLKLLLREEVPSKGKIAVGEYNLEKIKKRQIPYLRRKLGVVFQDFRLIPTMTAYENVAFAMRVTNVPSKEIRKRVPYILHLVGLTDKARVLPSELSGGEQQRVALARALVHNPPIIIADEPTGNIDPELSYEIMELLTAINNLGTTVIVVTHERTVAASFGRRTIMLKNGRLVSDTGAERMVAAR
jgi:cell division transport system ATP-binding protein